MNIKKLNSDNNTPKILSDENCIYELEDGFNSEIILDNNCHLRIKSKKYTGLVSIFSGIVEFNDALKARIIFSTEENTSNKNTYSSKPTTKQIIATSTIIPIFVFSFLYFLKLFAGENNTIKFIFFISIAFLALVFLYLVISKKTQSSLLIISSFVLCTTLYASIEFSTKFDSHISNDDKTIKN